MLTFRFLHRVTLKIIATFLALTAAQAAEVVKSRRSNRDIFELSRDAWTREGTANEHEMKLSLDMSRQSLKMVRQELTPDDMYDFAPVRKAKQELEAKGWTP